MVDFFKNKKILTLLAHPDDEMLGCGGTLVKATEANSDVHCYIPIKRISKDCEKAMEALGVNSLHWGWWEDNKIDDKPLVELCKFFEKAVEKVNPDIVFIHHHNCTNQDHRLCYQAAIVAARNSNSLLLSCEIPSSTNYLKPVQFEPNFYVELTVPQFVRKLSILGNYETEVRKYPHPRSFEKLRCLAETRGSDIGVKYAEAFMLVKGVV